MKASTMVFGPQPSLFGEPLSGLLPKGISIDDDFERFHCENPHVYKEILALCRLAKSRGRNKWSTKGIFEVMRWSRMATHGEDFKLRNDFTALYARLVMENEPDLEDFFETRERKAC